MITKHESPALGQTVATAPYNFIPLPQKVFSVGDGLEVSEDNGTTSRIKPWSERRSEFIPGTLSGWIDLEIEPLTPVFIRGPKWPRQETPAELTKSTRLRPQPYCLPDGRPALPGSSVRGMTRNLLEILTFSRIQPVTKERPFYRSVGKDRIGRAYRASMGDIRSGVLRRSGDGWYIYPCASARVPRALLPATLYNDGAPNPDLQYSTVYVQGVGDPNSKPKIDEIELDEPKSMAGWSQATLVITGDVGGKRHEFVFFSSEQKGLKIADELVERFQDDDQITQWQERAFPVNFPTAHCRAADGRIRDAEPVFYLTDGGSPEQIKFFGRARMFRLPYDRGPSDLIGLGEGKELDMAEALFGRVKQGPDDPRPTIKGRLRFEDCVADWTDGVEHGPDDWYEPALVPHILSSPKVTTFQHYLNQPRAAGGDKTQLLTYLSDDLTNIRGHKLYWHRWDAGRDVSQIRCADAKYDALLKQLQRGDPGNKYKQHTLIRPVKADTKIRFRGRVRFENLTPLELGALLVTLRLPEGCAHKIGMAKPLGLGSIRITATPTIVDRAQRYKSWAATGATAACTDAECEQYVQVFVDAIMKHANDTGEISGAQRPLAPAMPATSTAALAAIPRLNAIPRLAALFLMLKWDGRPSPDLTAPLSLDDFQLRRVLPSPFGVVDLPEPSWPGRSPQVAAAPAQQPTAQPPARSAQIRNPPIQARTAQQAIDQNFMSSSGSTGLFNLIEVDKEYDAKLEWKSGKWVATIQLGGGSTKTAEVEPFSQDEPSKDRKHKARVKATQTDRVQVLRLAS